MKKAVLVPRPAMSGISPAYGQAVSCAGDVNGDGVPDLAASANRAASRSGQMWVFLLDSTGTVLSTKSVSSPAMYVGCFTDIDTIGMYSMCLMNDP